MLQRAYSILDIKALDSGDGERIIEGFATTPLPDRSGDVMDPKGAVFSLPIPLLWQHDQREPIGEVFEAKIGADGIRIKARIAKIDDAGRLKDRLDEAWHSIKSKLVRGLSIGYKAMEPPTFLPKTNGFHFSKWAWAELSAVTIPMNVDASILTVKSYDLGVATDVPDVSPKPAGATAIIRRKQAMNKTIAEQKKDWQGTLLEKTNRMSELMTKAQETGVTLDKDEEDEYDRLKAEVQDVQKHLGRLDDMERLNISAAVPVVATAGTNTTAQPNRMVAEPVRVKSLAPKGSAITRMAMCLARSKGDSYQAIEHAKSWKDAPEVELLVKAAVAAGTTTDATWAGPLAVAQPLVDEFLELLRPRTLIGRVPGFRQVPFNVSVPSQTGGGTYSWVGQGNAKPVTSAAFATVSVPFSKAAGIIVLTEELVRLSTPSAEATVREEMIGGMGQFLDGQLIDPAVAAVANVNPASITNGAATAAASGATGAAARADLAARVATFTAANIPLDGAVWLMSDSVAFGIGLSLNALGQPLFPGMDRTGGNIMGIPVIVSNNVGNRVILVHAPSILFADEGGVAIDVSREASVQMDSAPANPSDATTVLVSLWQRNLVGLRAERMITWIRARTAAVTYISAAAYNGS